MTNRCATVRLLCAVAVLAAGLAGCKSPAQIQAEQDQADDRRCARLGVPIEPGNPQYIQCRMWAAQLRAEEEQARRAAWLQALAVLSAGRRRMAPDPYGATPYDAGPFGANPYGADPYGATAYGPDPYSNDDDDDRPHWITPPAMPQWTPAPRTTWCRPVGGWTSCTQY